MKFFAYQFWNFDNIVSIILYWLTCIKIPNVFLQFWASNEFFFSNEWSAFVFHLKLDEKLCKRGQEALKVFQVNWQCISKRGGWKNWEYIFHYSKNIPSLLAICEKECICENLQLLTASRHLRTEHDEWDFF